MSRKLYIITIIGIIVIIIGLVLLANTWQSMAYTQSTIATSPMRTVTEASTASAQKIVKIGVLAPLTGGLATQGIGMKNAVQLALEDINSMCRSVKFEIVVEDTATDPNKAVEKISTLYGQGIKAIVGPLSSAETAAVRTFSTMNKIIVISPTSVALSLALPREQRPYLFRMSPTDDQMADAFVTVLKNLEIKKIAILYRRDTWGEGQSRLIRERAANASIRVLALESYDPTPAAFPLGIPAAIDRLSKAVNSSSPDTALIILGFEDDGILAIKTAAQDPVLGRIRWFVNDAIILSDSVLRQVGNVMVQHKTLSIVRGGGNPNDPNYQNFVKKFKDKYGIEPGVFDIYSYDSAMMLMQAICQIGADDPDKIRAVLEQWGREGTYAGLTGKVFFNQYNDRTYVTWDVYSLRASDGKIERSIIARYDSRNKNFEILNVDLIK